MMLSKSAFTIPIETERRLDGLVDKIEARQGDIIDVREFEERQRNLNVRAVLNSLPEGMTEEDLAGILKLALLTECATESYASAIQERAEHFDARWLARFNERVWTPDELTHHTPYKLILLNLGFAESELDREIRETQEKQFVHYGGDTPVHVTTFGMVQEYLTDNWHGLISKLFKQASPDASYMALRIKKRETLHTVWYRDMTALQVEANPRFVAFVAEEIARFHMPGNSLVPELQSQGIRWLHLMNADFDRIFQDLLRLIQETLGNVRQTGELVMKLASEKGVRVGPLPARQLEIAINRLGGPGYGLIGEAVLERAGLSYMFKQPKGAQDSAFLPYMEPYERIRALLRSWIATRIPQAAEIS
jgi:hypothetical protein